jgi:hypothetical protein
MELPLNYDASEPEFWRPIFKKGEMMKLKEKIHEMLAYDKDIQLNRHSVREIWSSCQIIRKYFPSYFIPRINDKNQDVDFSNYQMICCTTMLLFGILAARFSQNDQDYDLIFKGGKAIQMGLDHEYNSEDIDILVEPILEYDPVMMKNISGHIALLIQWFLPFQTSVLQPPLNPTIYKVSYQKSDHRFKAFLDIDFKQIDPANPYFKKLDTDLIKIKPLKEMLMFKRPSLEKILEEKIHYYSKYNEILKLLNRGIRIEGMTIQYCKVLVNKFKRAILAIAPETDLDRL